jgi:hypothetical protein
MLIGAIAILAIGVTAGFSIGLSSHSHTPAANGPPGKGGSGAASSTTAAPTTTVPVRYASGHGSSLGNFPLTTSAPPTVAAVAGLAPLACPAATVTVHDSSELQIALNMARAGDVIQMADGVYYGRFTGTGAGTSTDPIWLCGDTNAIIDDSKEVAGVAPAAGDGNYGFHLVNASWWNLVGFSVRNAQKGVMLDHADNNTLYGLTVYNIGDEAIHLREFSSNNTVKGCVVRDTGLRVAFYGEGIYIGTADKNWPTYTAGLADQSNNNSILYNDISNTTAENIDIKEGTSGGLIEFNHFDGTGMVASAATAWVNVKGNNYSLLHNTGQTSIGDGFTTHKIIDGDGEGNVFSANTIGAGVVGYGFAFHSGSNTLKCDNVGTGSKGQSNVKCEP